MHQTTFPDRSPRPMRRILSGLAGLVLAGWLPCAEAPAGVANPAQRLADLASAPIPAPVATPVVAPVIGAAPKPGVFAVVDLGGGTFSDPPTDVEITRWRLMPEIIVPAGTTTPADNRAMVAALRAYHARTTTADASALSAFIAQHPDSPWRIAVQANLGLIERQQGFFSRALVSFRGAWDAGHANTDPAVSALVDRAAGEYAILLAWIGRLAEMDAFFREVGERGLRGLGAEKYAAARQGRLTMSSHPDISFKCGPYAVRAIATVLKPEADIAAAIEAYPSTPQGTSLDEVRLLAEQHGIPLQAARRTPGAVWVTPAVLHWKLGHFSALIRIEGDRALLRDRTMDLYEGQERWVPVAALDEEASGAFLVRAGPLPEAWSPIAAAEAGEIWGKGNPGTVSDTLAQSTCDAKNGGSKGCKGMATYSFHLLQTSLSLTDQPIGYTPPVGMPITLDMHYNEKDTLQPAAFVTTNFGPKWTCNWVSYIVDDATSTATTQQVKMYLPGGGGYQYTLNNGASLPQRYTGAMLFRVDGNSYMLRASDNSRMYFYQSDGGTTTRRVYLSAIQDSLGNVVSLAYEAAGAGFRLKHITDPRGLLTTFTYRTDDVFKVDRVTDPYGRAAIFEYNAGRLSAITDPVSIRSAFEYQGTSDVITALVTPYGRTTFRRGTGANNQRWIEAVDPQGDVERAEFVAQAIPMSEPVAGVPPTVSGDLAFDNTYLGWRNTFYWDKKAMRLAPNDYSKALVYHWLHGAGETGGGAGRLLESIRPAFGSRVYFLYPGMTSALFEDGITVAKPSLIARQLDDGTTQRQRFTYNDRGEMLTATDPLGRVTTYERGTNGFDVLSVRQGTGSSQVTVAAATYNTLRQPLTMRDAAGNLTRFAYRANGQIESVTNARNETVTFQYDAADYLTGISDPLGGLTQITYDSFGRPRTITSVDGHAVTTDYDALDRPTRVTYPDGTFEQIVYDRLDPARVRNRQGQWALSFYNALRQPVAMRDPQGAVSLLEWCRCGALQGLTDANGNTTRWTYDVMARPTQKRFADGRTISYAYEPRSGRLSTITDAKNQVTRFTYLLDDQVQSIAYENAEVATAGVTFAYDTLFGRLSSRTDGTAVTAYQYHPITADDPLTPGSEYTPGAGLLASVDGPLTNDTLTLAYDELLRPRSSTLGAAVAETVSYDALGRVAGLVNGLGTFTPVYVGGTGRIASMGYPNGLRAEFAYQTVAADSRLAGITWRQGAGGPVVTAHSYQVDTLGQITSWGIARGGQAAATWSFAYDRSQQLLSARRGAASGLAAISQAFRYDAGGNRTAFQTAHDQVATWSYNNVNQLLSAAPGGRLRVEGRIDEPGSVRVGGQPAEVQPDQTFVGHVDVAAGQNTFPIEATDQKGNRIQTIWRTVNIAGAASAWTYDANGNLTSDGARTYTWDAADRLVAIQAGTRRSEFAYNGLGQRVRITERDGTTVLSDQRLVWIGARLAEVRDAGGATVIRRYLGQGEIEGTTLRYYTTDHLGSIRDVIGADGTVLASYDYDAYGVRTRVGGAQPGYDCERGYTGHFHHAPSGLIVTWYRFYDASTGRWLSRDPIGEMGGVNLYGYVGNNAMNRFDPLGLCDAPGPPPVAPPDINPQIPGPVISPHILPFLFQEAHGKGKLIMTANYINDSRYHVNGVSVWEKYSYARPMGDGSHVDVHYMKNLITGEMKDFKVKTFTQPQIDMSKYNAALIKEWTNPALIKEWTTPGASCSLDKGAKGTIRPLPLTEYLKGGIRNVVMTRPWGRSTSILGNTDWTRYYMTGE